MIWFVSETNNNSFLSLIWYILLRVNEIYLSNVDLLLYIFNIIRSIDERNEWYIFVAYSFDERNFFVSYIMIRYRKRIIYLWYLRYVRWWTGSYCVCILMLCCSMMNQIFDSDAERDDSRILSVLLFVTWTKDFDINRMDMSEKNNIFVFLELYYFCICNICSWNEGSILLRVNRNIFIEWILFVRETNSFVRWKNQINLNNDSIAEQDWIESRGSSCR